MFLIHDDKKKRWGKPPDGTSEKAVPEIHDSLKAEDEAPLDENIADLVRQAQNGDDDAFSELVRHYEKFVYNTACKALSAGGRSIDGADDIAQSAFIKAWLNLSLFRGECTFSTWLYRITVNTARDMLRYESRRGTVSLVKDTEDEDDGSEWDVPVTSGDTIPEDAMERKEAILAVRRAIEELPEDQRQIIVMRDLHELSYQEIADKLGIELGTVRSRINRGRQKLKNILENGNFFGFPSSKG
ncbi:MAG: sigma-70 family RNA polymerase sigma factor [Clostridia bacterium]|nr:sigma-70 family RNA polymerase sigma factor [Clostridia bacterium]